MVWTCRAQHRLDCRSTQAECGCTEKIWQAKEIMGWSAWEWQKEARYGFCWPSKSFWVERTPSRKTCQKAQPSVEENRALKWIWWWWWCFTVKCSLCNQGVLLLLHIVLQGPAAGAGRVGYIFSSLNKVHKELLLASALALALASTNVKVLR